MPHGSNWSYTEVRNLKSKNDIFLMQYKYKLLAVITFDRLCQSRYNILVSRAQERLWRVLVKKIKLASLRYFQQCCNSSSHLEYLLCWLLTVINISKNHSAFNFRIKPFKISWSCKCLMSEENWLWSWGYRGGLVHWNKPQVHSKITTSIAALLP